MRTCAAEVAFFSKTLEIKQIQLQRLEVFWNLNSLAVSVY